MAKLKQLRVSNELWIIALVTIGLPAIAWVYLDWRAALATFVVTQIALGILKERYN